MFSKKCDRCRRPMEEGEEKIATLVGDDYYGLCVSCNVNLGGTGGKTMEDLKALIAEAKAKRLWLHCSYQNMWFSPQDLEKENTNGKFNWSAVNFTLRDPKEYIAETRRELDKASKRLEEVTRRVYKWTP